MAINRRVRERQRPDCFRVIPVFLPGARRDSLPGLLVDATWVEFRDSIDDSDAFHRLVSGIRGVKPGPGELDARGSPRTTHNLPFAPNPGFTGREEQLERLGEPRGDRWRAWLARGERERTERSDRCGLAERGGGTLSSSDGQRFPMTVRSQTATAIPRYFGYGCGLTFYTWTSDQFSQYGSKPIPSTVRGCDLRARGHPRQRNRTADCGAHFRHGWLHGSGFQFVQPVGFAVFSPPVAFSRRAREVADRRQRQKVIEPGEVHERCFVGIKTKKISIGQQPRQ